MNAGNNISTLFDRSGNLTPDAMQRYLSGKLSPTETEAVEAHLESSPFDLEAMEGLRKHPAMNAGQVVAGLDAQIRQAALQKAYAPPKPFIRRYYWAAAAGLAGLVGLTVLLVFMFRSPSSQQLAVRSSQSEVSTPEPGTRNPEPGTVGSQQSAVSSPESGIRNPEPETRNQEPETRNQEQLAVTNVQKFTAPVIKPDEEVVVEKKSDSDEMPAEMPVLTYESDSQFAVTDAAQVRLVPEIVAGVAVTSETSSAKRVGSNRSTEKNSATEMVINYDMGTQDTIKKSKAGSEEKLEPLLVVEQMPNFPGGETELYKYLQKNIQYPASAKNSGITGTVYVRFIVDNKGKISNVTLLRGIGGGCDEEAIRVVKEMPDWTPGKQNGKSVPVYFTLPVKFILQD